MQLLNKIRLPILTGLSLVAIIFTANAQEQVKGKVSFITSENVYVRFESTDGISIGDTLKINQNGQEKPCLLVVSMSSTSCVTKKLADFKPQKGMEIITKISRKSIPLPEVRTDNNSSQGTTKNTRASNLENQPEDEITGNQKPTVNGRISLANYTTRDDLGTKNRAMGRLALNVADIGPGLSFESYMNYSHLSNSRQETVDFAADRFNIFNLALGYKKDSNYTVYLGRKINNNLASLGAVDGLQAEKQLGKFAFGIIGGFRPNIFNYGLDFSLPQMGAYLSFKQNHKWVRTSTTIGAVEQRNAGATDRRYALFQHSSQVQRLSLFASGQFDLYQKVNNVTTSDFKLSSIYASLQYRLNPRLSITASFDNRRNLIFYESYSAHISSLLANDPSRQGIRLRGSQRLGKYLFLGLGFNRRVQSDKANSFTNYNAYLRHSKLPYVGGSLFISYNTSQTSGLNYTTGSANYNRWFFKQRASIEAYYRIVSYKYHVADFALPSQHYFGSSINMRITKKTTFSVVAEHTQRSTYSSDRLNIRCIKRF